MPYGHRPGLFYGQCLEISGANHRFMPICLDNFNGKFIFCELITFH